MLRLSQSREARADELSFDLFRVLSPISQGAKSVLISMDVPADKISTAMLSLTSNGAYFPAILSTSLTLCANMRLTLVHQLLQRSPVFTTAVFYLLLICLLFGTSH